MIEQLEPRRLFAGTITDQIIVDQFGWRAGAARKVVLFADPINGQNGAVAYAPGATFEVRRVSDDAMVLSGVPATWRAGATHADSGDRVWSGDFSALTSPGEYYVYDPANNLRSYAFRLEPNLYNDILKTSIRTFYYQRTGTAIAPAFGGNWTHAASHVGPNQDSQARLWQGGGVVPGSAVRDVSGGWIDAGDYNKYVPWTTGVLWNLLSAYGWNPGAFGDAWQIPESGNGVPDVLDEVKWELDWLRKMQLPDGSVLNRNGSATYDIGNHDPSTDTQARYYTAATTWATASFAASLAHAARIFAAFEPVYPGYAATLLAAAQNAWGYLQSRPAMFPADGTDGANASAGGIRGGAAGADAAADLRLRILAAAELYKTTGNATYKSYFEGNYKNAAATENSHHPLLGGWAHFDASLGLDLNRAFVTYATTPGASASIVNEIKTSLRNMADGIIIPSYDNLDDPYRGFMWSGHYTWGSNQLKSEWANLLVCAVKLNVNPANTAKYREAAEEYLHYFHGRNPLATVYLSNMGAKGVNLGGDKSAMQVYHSWFGDGAPLYDGAGSTYGPVPGFLVGGPNQYFSVATLNPPAGQPPMKAFKDWNTSWPENSWEITEPAIYYQAAYSLLLSQFTTDTAAPQVFSASFAPAQPTHDRFTAQFNEPLASAALLLENLTTGATLPTTHAFDTATNTSTFTHAAGLLPDGHYRATVTGVDAGGNASTPHVRHFLATRGTAGADRYEVRTVGGSIEVMRTGGTPLIITAPLAGLAKILLRGGGGSGDVLAVVGGAAADNVVFDASTITLNTAAIEYGGFATRAFASAGGGSAGDGLSVNGGITVALEAAARLTSLNVAAASVLDVRDHDLVIDYAAVSPIGNWIGGSYDGITGQVKAGRIAASLASTPQTTLGVAEARDALNLAPAQTATWGGFAVDATSDLVKFTWGGDATLDGRVNIDDYGQIDSNVARSGAVFGWFAGDFNYDGKINIDDYGIIDTVVALRGAPL